MSALLPTVSCAAGADLCGGVCNVAHVFCEDCRRALPRELVVALFAAYEVGQWGEGRSPSALWRERRALAVAWLREHLRAPQGELFPLPLPPEDEDLDEEVA